MYEFAQFLQLSGQLPPEAVTGPEFAVNHKGSSGEEVVGHSSSVSELTASQVHQLENYYLMTVPEYHSLHLRYQEEKNMARKRHRLRAFPGFKEWTPCGGPPLMTEEREMCQGPGSEITKQRSATSVNRHGRLVRFSSKESDKPNSACASSYVCLHQSRLYGRISFFFEHTFLETTSILAFVHWFDGHSCDTDSGLLYVNQESKSSECPVVSIGQLSKPLVTATDPDIPGKLWFLNNPTFSFCQ